MPAQKKTTLKQWIAYTKKALDGEEGNDIWTIMTAMRGPDMEQDGEVYDDDALKALKLASTSRIRYACFGYVPYNSKIGAYVTSDEDYAGAKSAVRGHYGHFFGHTQRALDKLEAIGLLKQSKTL